jgi:hypothetical protein
MNAPFCPINNSQIPSARLPRTAPALLPSIPIAVDLPSLIRSVNIMRDIIRNITTSLTVNNVWLPRTPRAPAIPATKIYIMSEYPYWSQAGMDTTTGYVLYKAKNKEPDKEQRAYVNRVNVVEYRNPNRGDDKSFVWRITKRLDTTYGESHGVDAFKEDFFERIVNVHWASGLAVEFGDGAGAPA